MGLGGAPRDAHAAAVGQVIPLRLGIREGHLGETDAAHLLLDGERDRHRASRFSSRPSHQGMQNPSSPSRVCVRWGFAKVSKAWLMWAKRWTSKS